jgi:N-glycosylase/DNA lyase
VALAIATVLASFNGKTEEWWKFFWKVVLQVEDRMKDMTSTLRYLSEIQRDIIAKIHKKCFIS